MWKAYLNYIKNNPEGYWFKRKVFGWGWTPATWQGWLVTIVFMAFVIWSAVSFGADNTHPSDSEVKWFLARVFSAAFLMIAIAWKTGERLSWQWGIPSGKGLSKDNSLPENVGR